MMFMFIDVEKTDIQVCWEQQDDDGTQHDFWLAHGTATTLDPKACESDTPFQVFNRFAR
jgi:hypothetical protein